MANDSSRFKRICDNVIARLISALILAVVAGIGTFLVSSKYNFTKLEVWLMAILSALVIINIAYLLYRILNRKLPVHSPVQCDLQIVREERIHRWVNENEYIHKRRYTIKALRNGLQEYEDKFRWTGTAYRLFGDTEDYSIVAEGEKNNVFDVYRFKFSKPLNKGEEISVEAEWEATGPAEPFFSTTIEEPTDFLVMRVVLFPQSGVKKVNCEVCPNIGAKLPKDRFVANLDSDGEYIWEVSKPKILHHYEINWKNYQKKCK